MSDLYKQGDNYIIDDVTGLKIRAGDALKQWDGLIVHKNVYEPRHPQDFVRAVRDIQTAANPRPRQIDTFIGPLDTEIETASAAGIDVLHVLSTTRMVAADKLSVMLDNNNTFLCTIVGVLDATNVQITPKLPYSVSPGNKVYDNTAMAQAQLP